MIKVIQQVHYKADTICQQVGCRSYQHISDRNHDHKNQHRGQKTFDHIRQMLIQEPLSVHCQDYSKKCRQHRGCIGVIENMAEQLNVHTIDRRDAKRQAHCNGCKNIGFHSLCNIIADQRRKEEERSICNTGKQNINACLFTHPPQCCNKCKNTFDHTCCTQHHCRRRKCCCNKRENFAVKRFIFLRLLFRRFRKAGNFAYFVIDFLHMCTNQHLILAPCNHNTQHAISLFQLFGLCLFHILQLKAQTSDAMRQRNNIFFATDQFKNFFCQFSTISFFCHSGNLLFLSFQLQGQPTAFQFCTDNALHLIDCCQIHYTGIFEHKIQRALTRNRPADILLTSDVRINAL